MYPAPDRAEAAPSGGAPGARLVPDEFGDWFNQRDPNFDNYLVLGEKRDKSARTIFDNYSNGLKTNCDAWIYNSSSLAVSDNMSDFIKFYKSEMERYIQSGSSKEPADFVKYDKIGRASCRERV